MEKDELPEALVDLLRLSRVTVLYCAEGAGKTTVLKTLLAYAVTRRRFPMGVNAACQSLQPEATAVMEVTKWLKPFISAKSGDPKATQNCAVTSLIGD